MHERFWRRFLRSRSDNLKSKTCTELSRSIENLKSLRLSVIALVLVVSEVILLPGRLVSSWLRFLIQPTLW
jgi:hypothetical protein